MSTRQRDADTKKYSLALAVLLILGVVADVRGASRSRARERVALFRGRAEFR